MNYPIKVTLLVLSMGLSNAWAQDEGIREELNDEISVLYPKTTLKKRPKRVSKSLELDDTKNVIINNNIAAPEVKEQPSSYVEASPVAMEEKTAPRKAREEIEKATEDTIVQQLEKDRIESEKQRAKKAQDVFSKPEPVPAPVVVAAPPPPPVVVTPVPVMVQEVAPIKESYKEEAIIVKSDLEKNLDVEEKPMQYYVGAIGGVGDYSTASNVQGKVAGGISFGLVFPEDFIFEASVLFSRYDITESRCDYWGCSNYSLPAEIRMDQTNYSIAAKYMFLQGRVRPLVGGMLSYVHRRFENKFNYAVTNPYYGGHPYYPGNRPASYSVDGGFLVGADVKLSKSFYLGADFKYLFNVSYERDEDPRQKYYSGVVYNGSQPIEELSYYIFSIMATFRF